MIWGRKKYRHPGSLDFLSPNENCVDENLMAFFQNKDFFLGIKTDETW